jgi:hypothetical protein
MRLIQGIVLGIAITIGAAFVHDTILPGDPAAPLFQKQQIVNWDVLGRVMNNQITRAKQLWNQAFGR